MALTPTSLKIQSTPPRLLFGSSVPPPSLISSSLRTPKDGSVVDVLIARHRLRCLWASLRDDLARSPLGEATSYQKHVNKMLQSMWELSHWEGSESAKTCSDISHNHPSHLTGRWAGFGLRVSTAPAHVRRTSAFDTNSLRRLSSSSKSSTSLPPLCGMVSLP